MVAPAVKLLPWLSLWILLGKASCISLRSSGPPKDFCIGDMCISPEQQHKSSQVFDEPPQELQSRGNPGCKAQEPNESRLVLFILCPAFHGSTALEGALMSSKALSTLCPHGDWECEGNIMMAERGYDGHSVIDWNFEDMLTLYAEVWDLQKPVLLEKNPIQLSGYEEEDAAIRAATMPKAFTDLGVKKLGLVYILMWRPYCLSTLSTNFLSLSVKDREIEEIGALKSQVDAHKYLKQQGEPVIVINLADLLWRPDYTEKRLNEFLPCLGAVDIDYVPEFGKDVFQGNDWKAHGSVRQFGASFDPREHCNYSLQTNTCEGSLPSEHVAEYESYSTYLASYSFTHGKK